MQKNLGDKKIKDGNDEDFSEQPEHVGKDGKQFLPVDEVHDDTADDHHHHSADNHTGGIEGGRLVLTVVEPAGIPEGGIYVDEK